MENQEEVIKTPSQWSEELHIRVLDADGWRDDNKNFHDSIPKREFLERCKQSTCSEKYNFPKEYINS